MSSSETSRMLSIINKVVPNVKETKSSSTKQRIINLDDDQIQTEENTPQKKPSKLQSKITAKETANHKKQDHSVVKATSTTDDIAIETQTKTVVKKKRSKSKKSNDKRATPYNTKEISSNWLSFLKDQSSGIDKSNSYKMVKKPQEKSTLTPLHPIANSYKGITPYVALDCEMVLVEGNVQALARCSIVNYNGHVLFDKIIRPQKKVENFLSKVSGITPAKLRDALVFDMHKDEIYNILKGRIIVGHTLKGDFEVLQLTPNEKDARDLSHLKSLKEDGKTVGLKKMTEKYLKFRIQTAEHNSVEDARAAMALFRMFEHEWKPEHKGSGKQKTKKKSSEGKKHKDTLFEQAKPNIDVLPPKDEELEVLDFDDNDK